MVEARTLVMIPAFNEGPSIAKVLADVKETIPSATMLVIDDGSADDTADVAEHVGATVLRLPFNLGIGGAIQAGYLYAERNDYEIAVRMDGDGQHNPIYIPDLIKELQQCDLVVGSRFIANIGFQSTSSRRIGIGILVRLLCMLTGKTYTDPTSGFRVANRRVIEYCAKEYPQDFPEVESIAQLDREGFSIVEYPVVMRAREHGKSSINGMKSLWYMVKVCLALSIGIARRPSA